ncbi:MAG: hypothetical protein EOO77_03855 [Oxalobacteraceae bacterium]|nr:MAG: hypothetical protein EOO77_03855 [Oxalobacteraceae bacterium]
MDKDKAEALRAAIQTTEYKYFGDYELSPDQWAAVDTLVAFAQRHLDAITPTPQEPPHAGE